MPRRPPDPQLVRPAQAAAKAIVHDLAARDLEHGSLRGAAAALLLDHALGEVVPARVRKRWEAATIAALELESASLFDGALGAAWALAITGRAKHALPAIDQTVLEILASTPWPGGLSTLAGGLTGFGVYGLARARTPAGREILTTAIAHLQALATTDRAGTRWITVGEQLPADSREIGVCLINMEGCAAAVGLAAAAAALGIRGARGLAVASARTLSASVTMVGVSNHRVGELTHHAAAGLVYGTGTWALGSSGVAAALTAAARMPRAGKRIADAVAFGTSLAHLDPSVCDAIDTSLGSGSTGIACTLAALYDLTGSRLFGHACAYWTRWTLKEQRATRSYFGALTDAAEHGSTWAARPDLLEGAAGTGLGLLYATGSARTGWERCLCL